MRVLKQTAGLVLALSLLALPPVALAKLPAPTPAEKEKADDKKLKEKCDAEVAKKQLAAAIDRVAANYIRDQAARGITVKPTPVTPPAKPAPALGPDGKPLPPPPAPPTEAECQALSAKLAAQKAAAK